MLNTRALDILFTVGSQRKRNEKNLRFKGSEKSYLSLHKINIIFSYNVRKTYTLYSETHTHTHTHTHTRTHSKEKVPTIWRYLGKRKHKSYNYDFPVWLIFSWGRTEAGGKRSMADSRGGEAGFQCRLCHLVTVWLWPSYFLALCFLCCLHGDNSSAYKGSVFGKHLEQYLIHNKHYKKCILYKYMVRNEAGEATGTESGWP